MISVDDLVKTAKASGSEESIVTVDRKKDYKVAIGIRLRKKEVEVFTAASIQLGVADDCTVDLERMTATIGMLWKLKDIGYCLCYCGNGSIYVERPSERADVEENVRELQDMIKSL